MVSQPDTQGISAHATSAFVGIVSAYRKRANLRTIINDVVPLSARSLRGSLPPNRHETERIAYRR